MQCNRKVFLLMLTTSFITKFYTYLRKTVHLHHNHSGIDSYKSQQYLYNQRSNRRYMNLSNTHSRLLKKKWYETNRFVRIKLFFPCCKTWSTTPHYHPHITGTRHECSIHKYVIFFVRFFTCAHLTIPVKATSTFTRIGTNSINTISILVACVSIMRTVIII